MFESTGKLKKFFYLSFVIILWVGCQNQPEKTVPIAKKVSGYSLLKQAKSNEKQWLSDYDFFEYPLAELSPKARIFPYDLNSALFSDYAFKKRFIYLPEGTKMEYKKEGALHFKPGSIIIKNFYYPKDFNTPEDSIRLIETRLLIRETTGWKPLNYVWSEDQKDAKLNYVGGEVAVQWIDKNQKAKTIPYGIPNLNECKNCHFKNDQITPIGPTIAQLNKKYSAVRSTQNQLERFEELGLVDLPISHSSLPKLPVWEDPKTGNVFERAKAYLHANCAHCHNVEGSAKNSGLYLTYLEQDDRKRGIFKPPIAAGKGSGDFEYDIVPGHPEESILIYRMKNNDPAIRMPEIGRVSEHSEGVALLEEYIKLLASN